MKQDIYLGMRLVHENVDSVCNDKQRWNSDKW